uniref:Uncharacterized protein n=1 Tax=Oryza glumipatula TaxID=40148 RepID=A0A0E0A1W7_9ORYZ
MAASLTTKTFPCNDGRSWTPSKAFASWVPFLDVSSRGVGASCVQEVVLWRLGLMFKVDSRRGVGAAVSLGDKLGNDSPCLAKVEMQHFSKSSSR